jgi:hypothetical protein
MLRPGRTRRVETPSPLQRITAGSVATGPAGRLILDRPLAAALQLSSGPDHSAAEGACGMPRHGCSVAAIVQCDSEQNSRR